MSIFEYSICLSFVLLGAQVEVDLLPTCLIVGGDFFREGGFFAISGSTSAVVLRGGGGGTAGSADEAGLDASVSPHSESETRRPGLGCV